MRAQRGAWRNLVTAAALMVASPGPAHADGAQESAPERLPLLQPAVVEYRWTFVTPHWVVESRTVDTRAYSPALRARRIDHGVLDVETKLRKVGSVAEFSCKYSDLALPNECRTTWRDVYVEVPSLVVRHDYLDVDVPVWSWRDWRTTVDVPRLVWKEETLVVSLPALAVPAASPRRAHRE